jgi:EAL domain-containing protein (putative c-di-GMP-specific phosphodiesterase class I)/DNA-binding NarL/FixJ family response regulator
VHVLGLGLLIWLVVSMVVMPIIGTAMRRMGSVELDPEDLVAIDLRAAEHRSIDLRHRATSSRRVVVVIDDDTVGRVALSSTLARAGYNTVEARGGVDAIRLPGDVRIDAIVVDEESCGSRGAVLRRVRSRTHQTAPPVVMVHSADTPDAWLAAGVDGGVTKPATPDELVAAVDLQVRRGTAWRHIFDSQAEEHAAVARVMDATTETVEPLSTANALCAALHAGEAVAGAALVSFARGGPTVLATAGAAPWNMSEGGCSELIAEELVLAAEAGPRISSDAPPITGAEEIPGLIIVSAPLGNTARPLGVLAASVVPAPRTDGLIEPGPEGAALATTIHLAGIATDLLRPQLENLSTDARARRLLERIIDQQSFMPVFQPIVDLTDGHEVGFEALTRFGDGADPASRFHEASALGVGLDLELATLRVALEHGAQVSNSQFLALNASGALLLRDDALLEALEGVDQPLVIEVSEHEMIHDYEAVRRSLDRIDHDVRLSVDDAGSGFASLRHILALRPDFVKLDRSWVDGVHDDPPRQALIAGVAHFVGAIDAVIVAEGVEAIEDRDTLIELGVQYGQGWLFGRPQPLELAERAVAR